MTETPLHSQRHFIELDGIRGLAVMLVIAYHSGVTPPGISLGPGGVVLFFVLSGFLISGILIDRRGTEHYYKNFWGRRVLRIFPLYYVVLAMVFLVLPHIAPASLVSYHGVVKDQAWYWLYLQNAKFAIDGFPDFTYLGHLWSLAVEEQFYLVWPFVVALVAPKNLRRICWSLVVVGYGSRTVQFAMGLDWPWSYTMIWSAVDSLAAGALIAIAQRADRLSPKLAKPLGLAVVGLIVVGTGVLILLRSPLVDGSPHLYIIMERNFTTPISVGTVILALILHKSHWFSRFLRLRFLQTCGKYSYAMYILHTFIVFLFDALLRRTYDLQPLPELLRPIVLTTCSIVVTLAASILSWHALEKPFLSLKRHFAYGQRQSAAPTV